MCFILDMLNFSKANGDFFFSAKVLFLNTDDMPALETNQDERVQNPKEADLVQIAVEALCASGVAEECIGVISVYRAQLKLLNTKLKSRPNIEVLTADRSHGRDKDCVIISLVRANENNMIGDLLRDWRRLNVTFTRAKSKLIIVGSRRTLESCNVLKAFLEVIDENGWAYRLPRDAEKLYKLPASVSLSQATAAMQINQRYVDGSNPRSLGSPTRSSSSQNFTDPKKRPHTTRSPASSPKKELLGNPNLKKPRHVARKTFTASPSIQGNGRLLSLSSSSSMGRVTRDIMVELGIKSRPEPKKQV